MPNSRKVRAGFYLALLLVINKMIIINLKKLGGRYMGSGNIDNLDIRISADANRAQKSLESLAKTLDKVNKSFKGMNTVAVGSFSRNVNTLASSLRALNGLKISVPKVSGLAKEMAALSKVDFAKLNAGIEPIRNMASAIKSMEGIENIQVPKIDTKNLSSLANAAKKFSDIKTENMPEVAEGLKKISESMEVLSKVTFSDRNLNNVINALNRLFKADFSKFNPSDFDKITKSISALSTMPDVSNSINRFVASLARLSNAGNKITVVSDKLPELSEALTKMIRDISKAKNISKSTNEFVSSIARLANAGDKATKTSLGLGVLAYETLNFFNVMKNAPRISSNTLRMVEALSRLASAGNRVGSSTSGVQTAFSKLTNLSTKAGSVVKKSVSAIVNAFKQLGNSSSSVNKATLSLKNLLSTALLYRGATGLYNWAKQATMLGSNITEVENVVNVAFGSMANQAYEFASTATEQFGLSELAAKQYSGTMMSMLKASGVATDSAAEMSTTLAGLSGDLASFYNIDTDAAFYKIRAGIAGEIEPLRQLGVDMTVASLEAYALANGITKSYMSMSQAEKVMLRYNYLMSVTSAQQGDWARTSQTFANQFRLLKLNFQSLSATMGQGFIAVILPVIQGLNALLAKLQEVAKAFRNFLYVLTGYESPGGQSGIVNDLAGAGDASVGLDDLAGAGEDASSGLDDATESAQDLKKALSVLSFDELNQLSSIDTSSLDSSVGDLGDISDGINNSLGNGELVPSDIFKDTPVEKYISELAERMRKAAEKEDWEELGKIIAGEINKGLKKIYDVINWNNVGPKITAFVTAFTRTFNSLVDNIDWNLMGRTIGAGINTIVNTLNLLIGDEGIDFTNIGTKIATGLRGAIKEIDWGNLGNLLGNYFMISWDMLSGFVQEMSKEDGAGITGWDELGTSLGEAVNGIFEKIDFGEIGTTLVTGINGAFSTLKSFTDEVEWDDLATNISTGINNAIHNFNWSENGQALNQFIGDLLGSLLQIAQDTDWEELGRNIGEFLGEIDWWGHLKTVIDIIIETLGGIFDGMEESGTAGKIAAFLGKAFIAVKIANITGIGSFIGKIVSFMGRQFMEGNGISSLSQKISAFISRAFRGASSLVPSSGGFQAFAKIFKVALPALIGGGIGMALSEVTTSTEDVLSEASKIVENFTSVVKTLGEQGVITKEQQEGLNSAISQISEDSSPAEAVSTLSKALEEAGISSVELKNAASEAGVSVDDLAARLLNSEKAASKSNMEIVGMKNTISTMDFTNMLNGLNSTSSALETVNFSNLILDATETIDSVGGIWQKGMDGWKQITGQKAIEIYQGIQQGIYKDNGQGYFDIGNGVLVSLGNGIAEGTENFKSTLDTTLLQALRDKLPEGYTLGYENGKVTVQQYEAGINEGALTLGETLNNATIAKINSILPQGSILTYQNGQWTIQQYASGMSQNGEGTDLAISAATIDKISAILPEGVTIAYNNGTQTIEGYKSGLNDTGDTVFDSLKRVFLDGINLDEELKEKYSGYAALSVKGYNEKIEELKSETTNQMENEHLFFI